MRRLIAAALVAVLGAAVGRADETADAVLDKAIKALGGADKLKTVGFSMEAKGSVNVQGNDSDVSVKVTYQGFDHMRQELNLKFGDMDVKGFSVQAGDKGWRKFGDMGTALEGDDLVNQKRVAYLGVIPVLVSPLKDKAFKVVAAGEEKVGDKPAAVLKVTGPEGKEFTICFDKETGLPAKMAANLRGFTGEEVKQETVYGEYKDMGGVKKATKVDSKRDGQKYMSLTVTGFKLLDKIDPKTFSAPE